jgi:hypothetical protein
MQITGKTAAVEAVALEARAVPPAVASTPRVAMLEALDGTGC